MVSIYDVKPKFQAILRPITNWLAAKGVSANQVTLAAVCLSFATGVVIYAWCEDKYVLLLLPVVLFARMALNAMDGMLAREHDMKSHLGAILNELGDVLSDTALYLPLAVVPGFCSGLVVTIVILAIVTEMAGVVAVQIGASRRYDGPMGKSDRAFVFGTLGFVVAVLNVPSTWMDATLALVVAALVITVWNRSRKALTEVRSCDGQH